ncbi:hybrid sensor histidine kinase/response regulator [Saccharospirillum mangrovi]|uniref:hybrid sensor histidine kinase/response regulator n=1 Tax=Saccharospirillum mangrovi TaxID=2161747 RepID=UPI0013B447A7|nr:response regulator [Saccharospirillum mangrovi]
MSGTLQAALDKDAKRLMVLVLIPMTLLFGLMGYGIGHEPYEQQRAVFDEQQIRALAESRALLNTALNRPVQHLTGTVANPFLLQSMSGSDPVERNRALAASLSGVALRNQDYMQLRWILPNGDEALRIDVDRNSGAITNLPKEALQNKADRPYHIQAMSLQPNQIGITPADLNVEFGEVEMPLRPTMRYSLRLPVVNGVDLGYLIFNLELNKLFAQMERLQGDNRLYLADPNGQWIMHENDDWTWGQLLNRDTNLAHTNPDLWALLNDSDTSEQHVELPSGRWRWSQLTVGADQEVVAASTGIWLLDVVPKATLDAAVSDIQGESLPYLAALALALLVLAGVLYQTQKRATELRRAHRDIATELDANLTFQQTLNNVLPALVIYWNRQMVCEYANATFERWFQLSPNELIGRAFKDSLSEEDYPELREKLQRAMDGETLTFERTINNEGVTQHFLTTYVPHQKVDPDDPSRSYVLGVISISTDLTDLIQARKGVEDLNQALAERTRQAETTAEAKSHFLANMSHEIRTPMNAIIGLLDIIRDTNLDAQQHDYINNARASAKSLLHVLNDILDLSKLEAGKLSINLESFDVERLFNNTVNLFDSAFYKKHVELLVWVDPRIPTRLKGDPHRLNQVLNNLVGNALKFTRQGEVIMAVTLVSKNDYSAHLLYSVKDTGIGIPTDKQQSIFEYFNQADNDTTREFGGTGLGLSICRTLVQLMDGSIGVRSTEGAGSEFYFELNHEIVEDSPHNAPRLNNVLVVDNSQAARKLTQAYLDSWNIGVDTAISLDEGLAAINDPDKHYDAILIDWQLGDESGLDLLNAVQAKPDTSPLTVMLTNQDPYDLLNELKARDITDVPLLKKPFTSSSLYDVLVRLNHKASDAEHGDTVGQQQQMREQAKNLSTKRILMVEDNALNQEIAKTLLSNLGVPLEVCDSGEDALQLIRNNDYDAILMDLHMPEMDGFETTRRIREIHGTDLPIIALSAAVMEDDIAQAKGAGMDDHVAKPIDLAQLVDTLYRWLPVSESADGTINGKSAGHARAKREASTDLHGLFVRMGEDTQEVMRRFQDQEATVRHLLIVFVRNYQNFNRQLDEAAQTDNKDELKRMLHTLKGTAGSLGLSKLSAAALDAESQAKVQWPVSLDAVQQHMSRVIDALKTLNPDDLPETPVSEDDAPAMLAEIHEIISRSRVVPDDMVMRLRGLAKTSPQAELYQFLIDQIDRFDYDNARATIERLKEHSHA